MAARITLKDIAREANVSVGLTSKALAGYAEVNEATQQRICRISKRLGYRPPSRRTTQQEAVESKPALRRVCLVFLGGRNSATAYGRHWIREITLASRRREIRLEVGIIESEDQDPSWNEELRRCAEDVDGLLLLGFIEGRGRDLIQPLGKPCVAIGDFEPGPRPVDHQVNIDKREMAYAATQALLNAGHRHIGFVAPASRPGSWNDQWLIGYRLALIHAGIPDDPALRPRFDLVDRLPIGVQAAAHMAALPQRPTAYVVPEIALAFHFRHAMSERGIAIDPHQMAIGGDPEEAVQFGLRGYPLFSEDIPAAATHALNLLQRIAQQEAVPPVQATVPCQAHHLDHLLGKGPSCPE